MRYVSRDKSTMVDIETKPAPMEQLERIQPFDKDSWLREKKASINSHKTYKAETKKKKLEALEGDIEEQKKIHYAELARKAALDPLMSEVLCITLSTEPGEVTLLRDGKDERDMLVTFWRELGSILFLPEEDRLLGKPEEESGTIIWWNGFEFDLPFLIARTRILDVSHEIPWHTVVDERGYWNQEYFMDLREIWCGRYNRKARGTLSQIARAMGHPGKSEHSGELIWELWGKDRKRAMFYITSEMQAMWDVAYTLGVLK